MSCKNCGLKSCCCYESSDLDSEGEDIFKMQSSIITHEVTEMMFRNNKDFYDDVFNKKFDIRLFKRSLKSDENIVAFLAFGKIFGEDAIRLLAKWVPNYRARFWWFVVKRHVFKKK